MKKLLILLLVFAGWCGASAQSYSYSSTGSCIGNTTGNNPNCSNTAAPQVGDLLFLVSYADGSTLSGVSTAPGFTSTTLCSGGWTQIGSYQLQSNGTGKFVTASFYCVVTTANTTSVQAVWTGAGTTFGGISLSDYTSTTGFAGSPVDGTPGVAVASTSTTGCPTGTVTTSNSADLLIATCTNFNTGQTWGLLPGWTNEGASSRNTLGIYDSLQTSSGAQSTTVPLSVADYGVGQIFAFKLNTANANHFVGGKAFGGGSEVIR